MNVMMYYITYVFQMAGLAGNANLLSSSIQYVINCAMTVPALIWLEKWGRRPTLLIGSTLMMTFLFANAGIMANYGEPYIPMRLSSPSSNLSSSSFPALASTSSHSEGKKVGPSNTTQSVWGALGRALMMREGRKDAQPTSSSVKRTVKK